MDSHCDIFNLTTSKEGDIVLDPFMGSGTTAAAAAKHNRHYIGFEINPEYAAISQERIRQQPSAWI